MELNDQLKIKGMLQAVDNANAVHQNWSEVAFNFLKNFAKQKPTFLAEDVRIHVEFTGLVPHPPSKRAWGGIFKAAQAKGIIKSLGIKQVKNPKAHKAYATYWGSLINV